MGLFKSADEKDEARRQRAAKKDADREAKELSAKAERERQAKTAAQRENRIAEPLRRAKEAAARDDVVNEEKHILSASEAAQSIHTSLGAFDGERFGNRWPGQFEQMLQGAIAAKELRKNATFLGFAGHIYLWSDRVLVYDSPARFHVLDGDSRASVETAGQLLESKRPTLTRMAAGAILPGTALIPGLAFQKKTVHDTRELYFVVEHPDYFEAVQIDPNSHGVLQQIAAQVNQEARKHASRRRRDESERTKEAAAVDLVTQLKGLAELRDSGVLTESEFQEQKERLLKKE